MMGRQNNDQGPLFYEFCLDEAVPDDHLARKIDAIIFGWKSQRTDPSTGQLDVGVHATNLTNVRY
jgi:hypothetical protein